MDFFEKIVLAFMATGGVAFVLERARRALRGSDSRQNQAVLHVLKSEGFDGLLLAARRWKRRLALCCELHEKGDSALSYALRDLAGDLDLAEWEKIRLVNVEPKPDEIK